MLPSAIEIQRTPTDSCSPRDCLKCLECLFASLEYTPKQRSLSGAVPWIRDLIRTRNDTPSNTPSNSCRRLHSVRISASRGRLRWRRRWRRCEGDRRVSRFDVNRSMRRFGRSIRKFDRITKYDNLSIRKYDHFTNDNITNDHRPTPTRPHNMAGPSHTPQPQSNTPHPPTTHLNRRPRRLPSSHPSMTGRNPCSTC